MTWREDAVCSGQGHWYLGHHDRRGTALAVRMTVVAAVTVVQKEIEKSLFRSGGKALHKQNIRARLRAGSRLD